MYIGIDLGGTNMKAALVDEQCQIVRKMSRPTGAERPSEEMVRDMALLCMDLMAEEKLQASDVAGVGIGVPGSVDDERGVIIYTCNLNFRNTPIREMFQKILNVPLHLGNDADCAALGESYVGASAGCRHSVMITLGTGVGGGIIINHKIYSGFNGIGGELGHMVIQKDGELCGCGRKGCWEAYSSATALIRMTREAMKKHPESKLWEVATPETVDGSTAFRVEKTGDPAAKEVVDEYCAYLACGLANIVNIFQPEVLTLGGGVANEGENLLNRLKPFTDKEIYGKDVKMTRICLAQSGNAAGLIGAAMLCK